MTAPGGAKLIGVRAIGGQEHGRAQILGLATDDERRGHRHRHRHQGVGEAAGHYS